MDYTVIIIFSNFTLSKIYNFLVDNLQAQPDELGLSKIERFRDKRTGDIRDSNRTLLLIKTDLYQRAITEGLDMPRPNLDFRIAEYELKERNFPSQGYTSNLYMILPKNIMPQELENGILEKMQVLVNFGVLKQDEFSLKIPLESRLTGNHRGFAYVSISENVDVKTKALIKVLLHDSFIHIRSIDKLYHLPVFWAKDNKVLPPIPRITKILKRE